MTNPKPMLALQDTFLNQARREQIPVTIHLLNGFQIKCVIKGFDSFALIAESEGKQMMIYKHAVSSITPSRPIVFNKNEKEE